MRNYSIAHRSISLFLLIQQDRLKSQTPSSDVLKRNLCSPLRAFCINQCKIIRIEQNVIGIGGDSGSSSIPGCCAGRSRPAARLPWPHTSVQTAYIILIVRQNRGTGFLWYVDWLTYLSSWCFQPGTEVCIQLSLTSDKSKFHSSHRLLDFLILLEYSLTSTIMLWQAFLSMFNRSHSIAWKILDKRL